MPILARSIGEFFLIITEQKAHKYKALGFCQYGQCHKNTDSICLSDTKNIRASMKKQGV